MQRPADWDQGVELLFYEGFRAHSADESRRLVPPENTTVAPPAYCGAYQDGERKGRDACAVQGADTSFGRTMGPWTIHASWDGRGEDLGATERDEARRTVVAFDAAGVPVAWWDTKAHPDAAMAIE